MNLDCLQNFSRADYYLEPFPHLIINNALNVDLYNKLKEEYDLIIDYFKRCKDYSISNKRLQLNSIDFLGEKKFERTLWRKFVLHHTSKEFFLKLLGIFSNELEVIYPKLYKQIFKKLEDKNFIGLRKNNNINNFSFDIVSDCQPGINTPVFAPSSVRGPHVDNPVEIFGGLFYLKDPKDDAGGNLEIYKIKNRPLFVNKAEVLNTEDLELAKTVEYSENCLVFFLNTDKSIHSISERKKTNCTRNLVNIIFETYKEHKLFDLNYKKNTFFDFFKKFIK
jgi:hypothetical protein